jgi:hypothetical protein
MQSDEDQQSEDPASLKYEMEFIAGGVVKDADGNVLDNSSEVAARIKLAELGLDNMLGDNEIPDLIERNK